MQRKFSWQQIQKVFVLLKKHFTTTPKLHKHLTCSNRQPDIHLEPSVAPNDRPLATWRELDERRFQRRNGRNCDQLEIALVSIFEIFFYEQFTIQTDPLWQHSYNNFIKTYLNWIHSSLLTKVWLSFRNLLELVIIMETISFPVLISLFSLEKHNGCVRKVC